MPICVDPGESCCQIRLEGGIGLAEAVELKRALLEGLASDKELQLDLQRTEEIDVTVMQLLHAAVRKAEGSGKVMVIRASAAAKRALEGAGFDFCDSPAELDG